jgi:cytochrome c553
MWQRLKRLRTGEMVIFGVVGLIFVVAVVNYAILGWVGHHSDKPIFPVRTHYEFSGEGFRGSELFRQNNCTLCHRAIGNGSNMSLNLDGIGSRHDLAYILAFLQNPEATYRSRTVDHGPAPKEAAYVAQLPEADLRAMAVFLSQLRTDRGGASAEQPPPGKSDFIDAMLDMWAPDGWRIMFNDVRSSDAKAASPAGAPDPLQNPGPAPDRQNQGNGNAH